MKDKENRKEWEDMCDYVVFSTCFDCVINLDMLNLKKLLVDNDKIIRSWVFRRLRANVTPKKPRRKRLSPQKNNDTVTSLAMQRNIKENNSFSSKRFSARGTQTLSFFSEPRSVEKSQEDSTMSLLKSKNIAENIIVGGDRSHLLDACEEHTEEVFSKGQTGISAFIARNEKSSKKDCNGTEFENLKEKNRSIFSPGNNDPNNESFSYQHSCQRQARSLSVPEQNRRCINKCIPKKENETSSSRPIEKDTGDFVIEKSVNTGIELTDSLDIITNHEVKGRYLTVDRIPPNPTTSESGTKLEASKPRFTGFTKWIVQADETSRVATSVGEMKVIQNSSLVATTASEISQNKTKDLENTIAMEDSMPVHQQHYCHSLKTTKDRNFGGVELRTNAGYLKQVESKRYLLKEEYISLRKMPKRKTSSFTLFYEQLNEALKQVEKVTTSSPQLKCTTTTEKTKEVVSPCKKIESYKTGESPVVRVLRKQQRSTSQRFNFLKPELSSSSNSNSSENFLRNLLRRSTIANTRRKEDREVERMLMQRLQQNKQTEYTRLLNRMRRQPHPPAVRSISTASTKSMSLNSRRVARVFQHPQRRLVKVSKDSLQEPFATKVSEVSFNSTQGSKRSPVRRYQSGVGTTVNLTKSYLQEISDLLDTSL
eukprot:snap_masked-scaffold_18-processed-gene-2.27-mRNA-1 protein AED:1.00 eAED:1.00 QI:0/-1/0/0/-1/1/1/0/652